MVASGAKSTIARTSPGADCDFRRDDIDAEELARTERQRNLRCRDRQAGQRYRIAFDWSVGRGFANVKEKVRGGAHILTDHLQPDAVDNTRSSPTVKVWARSVVESMTADDDDPAPIRIELLIDNGSVWLENREFR